MDYDETIYEELSNNQELHEILANLSRAVERGEGYSDCRKKLIKFILDYNSSEYHDGFTCQDIGDLLGNLGSQRYNVPDKFNSLIPPNIFQYARQQVNAAKSNLAITIKSEALRQYKHNDGREGFVFAYDKETVDKLL